MKKINIAELLKDCPKGMELDCTVYDNVKFEGISGNKDWPIKISVEGYPEVLNPYGCISYKDYAKCIIFPKGKTTWEGFQRSFKDGDIIFEDRFHSICIFKKEGSIKGTIDYYCGISFGGFFIKDEKNIDEHFGDISDYRFATEEEKEKLFKAIKDNGYRWNTETNTLERLIEPKFKVGDRIKDKYVHKDDCASEWKIIKVNNDTYTVDYGHSISFENQDKYELVPNKFDISSLKPFEKVLVRYGNLSKWSTGIFSHTEKSDNKLYFIVNTQHWEQCIPYKGNEHLRGTTDTCSDYFKTWE